MRFKVFLTIVLLGATGCFGSLACMFFSKATKHQDGSEAVVAAACLYVAVYALSICVRVLTGHLKST